MPELRFYISENNKELQNLIQEHKGFPNKSAYLAYCVEHYEKTMELTEHKLNEISQIKKNERGQDFVTKAKKLIIDFIDGKTDERKIVRDLRSGKIEPEVVVCVAYICEKIPAIFRNTKEIKRTIDYTKTHVVSKNDAHSKTLYEQIMDRGPKILKKSLEQQQEEISVVEKFRRQNIGNTQSKIFEFPQPPPLSINNEYPDDELEEITTIDNEKEEDELTV